MFSLFDIPEVQELVFRNRALLPCDKLNAMLCCRAWHEMCRPFLWEIFWGDQAPVTLPSNALLERNAWLIRNLETSDARFVRKLVQATTSQMGDPSSPSPSPKTGCSHLRHFRFLNIEQGRTSGPGIEDVAELISLNPGLETIRYENRVGRQGFGFLGAALLMTAYMTMVTEPAKQTQLCELVLKNIYLTDRSLEEVLVAIPTMERLILTNVGYEDSVFLQPDGKRGQPWKANHVKDVVLDLRPGSQNRVSRTDGVPYDLILGGCVKVTNLELVMYENTSFERMPALFETSLKYLHKMRLCTERPASLNVPLDTELTKIFNMKRHTTFTQLQFGVDFMDKKSLMALLTSSHRLTLEHLYIDQKSTNYLHHDTLQLLMSSCPRLKTTSYFCRTTPIRSIPTGLHDPGSWLCTNLQQLGLLLCLPRLTDVRVEMTSTLEYVSVDHSGPVTDDCLKTRALVDEYCRLLFMQIGYMKDLTHLSVELFILETSWFAQLEQQALENIPLAEAPNWLEIFRLLEPCRQLKELNIYFNSYSFHPKHMRAVEDWCKKSWPATTKILVKIK